MVQYEDIIENISVAASGHGESVRLPLGEVKIWRSPLPMGGPLAPPAADDEIVAWTWKAGAHYGPTLPCTRAQAWRHALDLYNVQADERAAGLLSASTTSAPSASQDSLVAALRDRVAELEKTALHPKIEGNPYALAALQAAAAARAAQMLKWPASHDAAHPASEWLAILALPTRDLATGILDDSAPRQLDALSKIAAVALAAHEALSRRLDGPGAAAQVVVTNDVRIEGDVEPERIAAAAADASQAVAQAVKGSTGI